MSNRLTKLKKRYTNIKTLQWIYDVAGFFSHTQKLIFKDCPNIFNWETRFSHSFELKFKFTKYKFSEFKWTNFIGNKRLTHVESWFSNAHTKSLMW